MNIKIICVGNLKEKFWKEACGEYAKRLSRFCKLEIVEVEEQNEFQNIDAILSKEGALIEKHLGKENILLAIEGKIISSEELAKLIEDLKLSTSEVTFIIGGSYGVDAKIKKQPPKAFLLEELLFHITSQELCCLNSFTARL